MSAHTPGPWRIDVLAGYSTELIAANGTDVAIFDTDPNEANGRLIEAAPDLLDLLQAGRRKLATYQSVYPGDKELRRLLTEWDAAIAKATGGQA